MVEENFDGQRRAAGDACFGVAFHPHDGVDDSRGEVRFGVFGPHNLDFEGRVPVFFVGLRFSCFFFFKPSGDWRGVPGLDGHAGHGALELVVLYDGHLRGEQHHGGVEQDGHGDHHDEGAFVAQGVEDFLAEDGVDAREVHAVAASCDSTRARKQLWRLLVLVLA